MIRWLLAASAVSLMQWVAPAQAQVEQHWRDCQQTVLPEFVRSGRPGTGAGEQYCYGLGFAFGFFEGGRQPARALDWYRVAAAQGHPGAQVAVGRALESGDGTAVDLAEALRWYRMAAALGDADAMFHLGRLYESGTGVARNVAEARRWFAQAAAGGHEQARLRSAAPEPPAPVADAATAPADAGPLAHYLDGLEALRAGDARAALAAFESALAQAPDDASLVLARGVARVLAEDFDAATADFTRYRRLGGPGREAELWTYVAESMSGRAGADHSIPVPRSLAGQYTPPPDCESGGVSVPGHVIQGGADYPTDYASFLFYEMAAAYREARCGAGVDTPSVREALARGGSWFANRNMIRVELAPLQLERARQRLVEGHFEAALEYAGFVRRARPDDPLAVSLAASAWLGLGRPVTARREFTIALTMRGESAEAYLGRATAAAMLGDTARARADIEVARRLDPAAADAAVAAVEAELSRHPPTLAAGRWRADLEAAAAGSGIEALMPYARLVHGAAGIERIRYDERYQDRVRELEATVRARPDDPQARVELARYLMDEAYPRGELVEPRRPPVAWRWQSSEADELERAVAILDEALALTPGHVRAMLHKAAALSRLEREAEAETIADQAIALAPNDPEALALYAYYKGRRANALNAEAYRLRQDRCSSSSHTEHRHDGIWEVTTTTCIPPSAADLARADQLDALAQTLRERSRQAMERAIAVTEGTYLGWLLRADAALWSGRADAAETALRQASALDPQRLDAHEQLALHYERMGMDDEALEQRIVVNGMLQTTAAPLLRRAWERITTTRFAGASADLARAAGLDPADARVAAWFGVVHEAEGRTAAAAAAYRLALALEQARIEHDEPAVAQRAVARDAADFGLLMAVRLRLAALTGEGAPNPAERLALLERSTAEADRFAPGWQAREMFAAMLPQVSDPGQAPPAVVNAATLAAETWLAIAELYKTGGRSGEAIAALRAASALGAAIGRPRIGTASGDSNFAGEAGVAAGDATVRLAAELIAAGDYAGAEKELGKIGYLQLSDQARRTANELQTALIRARDRQAAAAEPPLPAAQLEATRRQFARYAATAPLDPRLVGAWQLEAAQPYLTGGGVLTFDGAGNFSLVPTDGGEPRRGRAAMMHGQLLMLDDSGRFEQYFLEPAEGDSIPVTAMDASRWRLRRR